MENQKPKAYIFIGRSGCGKGTQADLLMKYLCEQNLACKTLHIESGALLREFVKGSSYSQKKCKEILDKGGLMPEFLVVGLWSNYLLNTLETGENIVFDGCPRKLHEAVTLDSALKFYKLDRTNVIFMNVSRDWSKARLNARKRADDTEEDIENRLNWFETEVMPTINYYKNNKDYNFYDINGEQTIEKVHEDIIKALE